AQGGTPDDTHAVNQQDLLHERLPLRHCAAGASAEGVSRRAISRAALSSSASISLRHSAFNGGDEAPGMGFLPKRVARRSTTPHPPKPARPSRKASRASRRTRLRVTARGAYFLPITR